MSLQALIEKYGDAGIDKSKWYTLKESNIRIPEELLKYIDLEEGQVRILQPIPEDLQPLVDKLQENYRKMQDPDDLTEYRR